MGSKTFEFETVWGPNGLGSKWYVLEMARVIRDSGLGPKGWGPKSWGPNGWGPKGKGSK